MTTRFAHTSPTFWFLVRLSTERYRTNTSSHFVQIIAITYCALPEKLSVYKLVSLCVQLAVARASYNILIVLQPPSAFHVTFDLFPVYSVSLILFLTSRNNDGYFSSSAADYWRCAWPRLREWYRKPYATTAQHTTE